MPRRAAAVGASPSAVVRKTGRPSPSSAARARVSDSLEPVDGRSRDARGLERANLGARHGMQAAGDDEPGASPGHRRGRPRVAQMSGGELREPRGAREDHVRRRDAGGGERVEVGLRLRVGRDDAARGAPERRRQGRASTAHTLERQVAHGPRGAAAQDVRHDRGVAGIRGVAPDRRGVGGEPIHAKHAAGDGAALGGEARAHERRRPPRHLEEGLDLRGDGAAERGVDLLEDEPGADPGAEVTGHGADARPCLGRRERPAFGVDDRDRAGGIDARRVHEHADPAASREMRAGIASSGQVVGDERDGHAPLKANTGRPGCVKGAVYTRAVKFLLVALCALRRGGSDRAGVRRPGGGAVADEPEAAQARQGLPGERARQSPALASPTSRARSSS